MKIMNGNERDRFEAAAAVHAEMGVKQDEDVGELGFLKHLAADSKESAKKQDL